MDAIDRKSIHHRGFSYVLGARSQFFEMPLGCFCGELPVKRTVLFEERRNIQIVWTPIDALPTLRAIPGLFHRVVVTFGYDPIGGHLHAEYFEEIYRGYGNILGTGQTIPAETAEFIPEQLPLSLEDTLV